MATIRGNVFPQHAKEKHLERDPVPKETLLAGPTPFRKKEIPVEGVKKNQSPQVIFPNTSTLECLTYRESHKLVLLNKHCSVQT